MRYDYQGSREYIYYNIYCLLFIFKSRARALCVSSRTLLAPKCAMINEHANYNGGMPPTESTRPHCIRKRVRTPFSTDHTKRDAELIVLVHCLPRCVRLKFGRRKIWAIRLRRRERESANVFRSIEVNALMESNGDANKSTWKSHPLSAHSLFGAPSREI